MAKNSTLSNVAAKENELDTLRELRKIVCDRLQSTISGRDTAALSRQLLQIVQRIDELKKETPVEEDEIAQIIKRRAADGEPGAVRPPRR